ncbi:MAG: metal ABC transporter substrate-binding protein [Endomicrobiales bacterium]
MKKYILALISVMLMGRIPAFAATVKIAAAVPDLGSIASYIGGDKVEVFSIAKSNANPHFVEVLPSYMIKLSRAALYLKVGLALDQWSDDIIDGSRNDALLVVDCSRGVPVLQKPAGKVDASMGDVHPEGNPHYWLDPANGVVIAGNVLAALKKLDPSHSSYYDANYDKFKNETEMRLAGWKDKMAKYAGQKIISYHSSWVYFTHAFQLIIAGNVEPLPGIPPTGKHLARLVGIITKNHITLLLQEPYFPDEAPRFLARKTGIKIFKFAPSCASVKADEYFKHFDEIVGQITK